MAQTSRMSAPRAEAVSVSFALHAPRSILLVPLPRVFWIQSGSVRTWSTIGTHT